MGEDVWRVVTDLIIRSKKRFPNDNSAALRHLASMVESLALVDNVLPELRCSSCGLAESENPYGPLFPVRVIVSEGEEGAADVTQLLCDDHAIAMLARLRELGFVDHHHGGADCLEDESCVGADAYGSCPTPNGMGEAVTVQPTTKE